MREPQEAQKAQPGVKRVRKNTRQKALPRVKSETNPVQNKSRPYTLRPFILDLPYPSRVETAMREQCCSFAASSLCEIRQRVTRP